MFLCGYRAAALIKKDQATLNDIVYRKLLDGENTKLVLAKFMDL